MPHPLTYDEDEFDRICEQIALGRSLRSVCKDEGMPGFLTVLRWLREDRGKSREKMAKARELQAETFADEIVDIADTTQLGEIETDKYVKDFGLVTEVRRADMVEHRKLRIEARKWAAGVMAPKKYGAKQQIEHSGQVGLVITDATDDELVAELIELVNTGRLKLPNGVQLDNVEDEEPEEDDFSDIA